MDEVDYSLGKVLLKTENESLNTGSLFLGGGGGGTRLNQATQV